jgi:hypothetical protein
MLLNRSFCPIATSFGKNTIGTDTTFHRNVCAKSGYHNAYLRHAPEITNYFLPIVCSYGATQWKAISRLPFASTLLPKNNSPSILIPSFLPAQTSNSYSARPARWRPLTNCRCCCARPVCHRFFPTVSRTCYC